MTIKTKFNINESVFFISHNKIQCAIIKGISVYINSLNKQYIKYNIVNSEEGIFIDEEKIFITKQDLLKSL